MIGKRIKLSKSSFKRCLYHMSNNDQALLVGSVSPSALAVSPKSLLGHYLAGLIEGDGSIIVPKTIRNQKGKLLYPVVKITFVKKDEPLANKIKEVLNGGTLVYPKGSNYLNLLFQDLKSLQKIAILLQNKMRTPKIEALHRLTDWLNSRLDKKDKIPKLGLDDSSLGDNPWLAGFIEADGNFYCSFDLNSKGIAVTLKNYMRISQKQLYRPAIGTLNIPEKNNSNFYIMENIREYLNIKNVSEIKRVKKDYIELSYEIRTIRKSSCNILISYLSIYPLFSSKHQDYLDWCKFYHLRLLKKYDSVEGTSKLILLKNSMNTKRTQFNWDSLNNFYCYM